jgi:hypothetical protein
MRPWYSSPKVRSWYTTSLMHTWPRHKSRGELHHGALGSTIINVGIIPFNSFLNPASNDPAHEAVVEQIEGPLVVHHQLDAHLATPQEQIGASPESHPEIDYLITSNSIHRVGIITFNSFLNPASSISITVSAPPLPPPLRPLPDE